VSPAAKRAGILKDSSTTVLERDPRPVPRFGSHYFMVCRQGAEVRWCWYGWL